MMLAAHPDPLARFRDLVSSQFGFAHMDGHATTVLSDVLQQRADICACTQEQYVAALTGQLSGSREWTYLADALTVGETYFFRGRDQLNAFFGTVIPDLRATFPHRPLSILCAGCSSGEEPYSLSMGLHDHRICDSGLQWKLTACDLNPEAIKRARAGLYSPWSLRETPPDVVARHFRATGRQFQVPEPILNDVQFEALNLAHPNTTFWQPGRFDVIFCRNVLMYLTPVTICSIIEQMVRSLSHGGYLFLGSAETMRGFSTAFTICQTHDAFYYRLGSPAPPRDTYPCTVPSIHAGSTASTSWMDAIDRSSQRINSLIDPAIPATHAPVAHARDTPIVAAGATPSGLQPLIDSIREERHGDIPAALASLPHSLRQHPLTRVIQAIALNFIGRSDQAMMLCEALLEEDRSNPLARFQLGLCCEQTGAAEQAIAHYRVVAVQHPGFTMAHLRLALIAQQRCDSVQARTEAGFAMAASAVDDDLNMALFSGGLPRRAIADLCQRLAGGPSHGG
jgi:chemotaxis protein methyltransferase CheR